VALGMYWKERNFFSPELSTRTPVITKNIFSVKNCTKMEIFSQFTANWEEKHGLSRTKSIFSPKIVIMQ
jgi:hypothetical protein